MRRLGRRHEEESRGERDCHDLCLAQRYPFRLVCPYNPSPFRPGALIDMDKLLEDFGV